MRSKSGPGGTLYHYGLCELAQRQAVLMRKYKPSGRAIKSDRAKVVMTAGCISRNFAISNYIYILREIVKVLNHQLEFVDDTTKICKDAYEQIDTMKKSILAKAFRGELGTNNPTEDSALNLLKEVLQDKS